jgi:hypothetical protein
LFYILISVLEFELRKAHETIKALRGSLTEATGKSDEFQMLSKTILKFVTSDACCVHTINHIHPIYLVLA